MRQKTFLLPTLRDVPSDADVTSHQLMLRAGMMRQTAAGVYTYLPLAKRVIAKVETIVREELEAIDAQELTMPTLHPAELWQETGRWDKMGGELIRLKDRHGRDFALGPTHEEVITSIIRDSIASYKKLPLNVFQIQTKFRDERRPRFGLLRGREFIMKDAYSFHDTEESLDETYQAMYQAYERIFTRVGLTFRAVIADSGAMGGKDTFEFMALADVGEDTIAYSDSSSYAANIEMAAVASQALDSQAESKPMATSTVTAALTISEAAQQLEWPLSNTVQTVAVKLDEDIALILLRADHELNEVKSMHELHVKSFTILSDQEIEEAFNVEPSLLSVFDAKEHRIIADQSIKGLTGVLLNSSVKDECAIQVDLARDLEINQYADLRLVQEGDASPDGQGTIQFARGIEIGQVFKLGTFYSESMGATYLDQNGRANPYKMGCYGIGISRTVAAIIEQHNDENGIVWPVSVAPFDLHLLTLNSKNEEQAALSEKLYVSLKESGWDVLYDDRPERAGVKFKDADLIGMPLRISVGKRASEGFVEVKVRSTGDSQDIHVDDLAEAIQSKLQELSNK
ncbi:proline--tRNA ligase [Alkalicoccobacillus murimartini]|uniref:Proline--tRNA ligase n=1 Tax=Alkalicoccobacillus murimartini TaxID=171685 RepID=A0ABT9YFM8_9BACI|nr:proline--tRNA ligase [Alkalicoccobacillus murimartini]MDQ0206310.1 prolyl-tRNA synthetase [Alkalicoccobacillus murimartini]